MLPPSHGRGATADGMPPPPTVGSAALVSTPRPLGSAKPVAPPASPPGVMDVNERAWLLHSGLCLHRDGVQPTPPVWGPLQWEPLATAADHYRTVGLESAEALQRDGVLEDRDEDLKLLESACLAYDELARDARRARDRRITDDHAEFLRDLLAAQPWCEVHTPKTVLRRAYALKREGEYRAALRVAEYGSRMAATLLHGLGTRLAGGGYLARAGAGDIAAAFCLDEIQFAALGEQVHASILLTCGLRAEKQAVDGLPPRPQAPATQQLIAHAAAIGQTTPASRHGRAAVAVHVLGLPAAVCAGG